jgi:methylenetetrahydrofolate reductase (NADPH)
MRDAGIADVFLIAGDASEPLGPCQDALELLPALRAHRFAPRTIGVPAYPEGHPFIDGASLARALRVKDAVADYMTTQLCFDPDVLLRWLAEARADGIRLPLYVGIPGAIDRRKLLEISMRVGVGNSVRFVRKQNGITRLFGRRLAAAEHLHAAIAPRIGERDLGIAGLHYFTFNRLVETARWAETRASEGTFTALACPATAIH